MDLLICWIIRPVGRRGQDVCAGPDAVSGWLLSSSFPCQIRTVSGDYNWGWGDCYRQHGCFGPQEQLWFFGESKKAVFSVEAGLAQILSYMLGILLQISHALAWSPLAVALSFSSWSSNHRSMQPLSYLAFVIQEIWTPSSAFSNVWVNSWGNRLNLSWLEVMRFLLNDLAWIAQVLQVLHKRLEHPAHRRLL